MKKRFGFLCASVLALGSVTGCNLFNKDKEPEKELTFSEYLEAQETLTAAKLDAKIGKFDFSGDEYLTALDIPNSKIVLNYGDSVSANGYIWTEVEGGDKFVYVAAPFGENAQQVVGKVNMSDVDSAFSGHKDELLEDYSMLLEDTNESGKSEFSEVIDNLIAAYGLDTSIYNVNTLLSKIDFDINDFTDKGNGVYKLKSEALVDLTEDLTGEIVTDKDAVVEGIDDVLNVEVKYEDNEIRQVKVIVTEEDESYSGAKNTTNLTFKVDFEYEDSEISKTIIDFVYSQKASETRSNTNVDSSNFENIELLDNNSYMHLQMSFAEKEFAYKISNGETPLKIEAETLLSVKEVDGKTTIKVIGKAVTDGSVMREIANIEIGLVANWLADANIVINIPADDDVPAQEIRYSLESTVNVTIPSSVKAIEAEDATEFVISVVEDYFR